MFLQLGDYIFEGIKLPQSWNSNYSTNYAQIPIIDGKPVVQRTGEKLVEVELSAQFRDEFCNPSSEVEALQIYRRNGNVLQLTSGEGVNFGRYVITDISITNSVATNTGYVSVINATIKLLEYNTTQTTVKVEGEALKSKNPVIEEPTAPMVPLSGLIQADIKEGIVKSNEVAAQSKKTTVDYDKISTLADEAVTAFDAANAKVQQTKKIIYRALNLQNTLTSAKEAANLVKQASDIHDLNSLLTANTLLEGSVYELKGAAVPVATLIGSREGGE
jgi:phage protein U